MVREARKFFGGWENFEQKPSNFPNLKYLMVGDQVGLNGDLLC